MSVYQYPQSYINRQLFDLPKDEWASKRLELDLAALLVGPTSGSNAERLAKGAATDPLSLALAMRDAAERYLNTLKGV